MESKQMQYYLNRAARIIERNKERIEQIELKKWEKAKNLETLLEEFKSIDQVWDARRFAEENEPNKGAREHNAFYVPYKNTPEVRGLLKLMYPECKSDINKMNQKQAYRAYKDIMYFLTKANH